LGFFIEARRDPFGYPAALAAEFGDVVRIPGPFRGHILFHPDHVKHVLQDNNRNYVKGKLIAKAKPLLGEGLFTSEGDFWRRQRRLAQPAFHRQRIESFATTMTDATSRALDRWQSARQAPLDLMAAMSDLTLGIVGRTLFSIDLAGDTNEVGRAMLVALEHLTHLVTHPFALPLALPTPRNLRFRRARRDLDRVVFDIIAQRRRTGADAPDFLSMLLQASDADTGERMSDRQLRDEVMTFVLAGHETTAVTLAWTWHLLADHPDVESRVRAEVAAALGSRVPTIADLPQLRFTRQVIDETLRLFPPVSGIGRQAINTDEVGGFEIPANSIIFLSPYVTHRHRDWWDNPDQFDPDRFTPERSASRHRFAYFPFSGGPRLCIGNEFALMEAQLILAMIVQRYRLTRVPGHTPQPELRVTMRPRNGVLMTLHPA
jgi:cytochrome P450